MIPPGQRTATFSTHCNRSLQRMACFGLVGRIFPARLAAFMFVTDPCFVTRRQINCHPSLSLGGQNSSPQLASNHLVHWSIPCM